MKTYTATLAMDNGTLLNVTVLRKPWTRDARRFSYITTIDDVNFCMIGSHKPNLQSFKDFRRSLPANPVKLTYAK